jgi:hypothetical protein
MSSDNLGNWWWMCKCRSENDDGTRIHSATDGMCPTCRSRPEKVFSRPTDTISATIVLRRDYRDLCADIWRKATQ